MRMGSSKSSGSPRDNKSIQSMTYPFSAIVGQADIKLGLVLNVIDPSIGGVLMMGHRGTGKSTAVRALADLLPYITVVQDCSFNCDPSAPENLCQDCCARFPLKKKSVPVPVVDLPLGATEDRVCGSIDIQRALTEGVKAFEPGLLARANRGFLYIDEVNLLEDHLVDLLLDVAVTGSNKVERENISVEHPAKFVLIGSGNPEEGELRPQLLDRFGLYVEVKTENEPEHRVEIVSRREAFDRDRERFSDLFLNQQQELQQNIARARRTFAKIQITRERLRQIATVCSELKVDGHRGELTIMRSARALAAFEGRKTVKESDVRRVAPMALRHRLRRDPLSDTGSEAKIENSLNQVFSTPKAPNSSSDTGSNCGAQRNGSAPNTSVRQSSKITARDGDDSEVPLAELPTAASMSFAERNTARLQSSTSRWRSKSGSNHYSSQGGRYIQATAYRHPAARIAIDATLRAFIAAGVSNCAPKADHLRYKRFVRKQGTLFIFAIDTSGSMAMTRINKARATALGLLKESYINRDSVAIIAFRGSSAELLLPPSRSILQARRVLESLSVGGGTPLSAGLTSVLALSERVTTQRTGNLRLLLFTDGGANVPLHSVAERDRSLRQEVIANELLMLGERLRSAGVQISVVETNESFAAGERAQSIARTLGARHVRLSASSASTD
jgi:magnesium chelatase subunit D